MAIENSAKAQERLRERLEAGLRILGLSPGEAVINALLRYINEIELWNPRLGLVEAEGEQIVIRHILDCIAGLPQLQKLQPGSIADLGSGAGLPGIPVALFLPGVKVTLVERSGRRVGFLKNAVALLGLEQVSVVQSDFERLEDRYQILSFRAFRPLEAERITQMKRILDTEGRIFAYKAKAENVAADVRLLEEQGAACEVHRVHVPFLDHERHVLTAWFPGR